MTYLLGALLVVYGGCAFLTLVVILGIAARDGDFRCGHSWGEALRALAFMVICWPRFWWIVYRIEEIEDEVRGPDEL